MSGSKRGLSGVGMMLALGLSGAGVGCSGEGWDSADEFSDDSAALDAAGDGEMSDEDALVSNEEAAEGELGTAQQSLLFFDIFDFRSSCSDPNGTHSTMAALAVATATELRRWQPTKDFAVRNGRLELTTTGKSQCADKKCWNTQALLDLQSAPAGSVQIRPGVMLDSKAYRSGLTTNVIFQVFSLLSFFAPEHKFQLLSSEPGGCDQFYWFDVKSPTGGVVSSTLTVLLKEKLAWVGGDRNPYIQFESQGTRVGIDPTYGLNEAGATAGGSCIAACTKVSSSDITGSCCSCNGNKKFSRSPWNATTYLCK